MSVVIFVACCSAAINLIDFYAVHEGKYDIQLIFMADGGVYGRFNPQALLAYALGIAVQIPLPNAPMYAVPIPEHLGNAVSTASSDAIK